MTERPFVIQRDGKEMIAFSGSGSGSGSGMDWTYAVGLATAESGDDLLDAASPSGQCPIAGPLRSQV